MRGSMPLLVATFLGSLAGSSGAPAFAGMLDEAKIVATLRPHACKGLPCTTCAPSQVGCRGSESVAITQGELGVGYDLYLVVAGMPQTTGVAGAEFMISYGGAPGVGLDVVEWTTCADLEFANPAWPDSGTGIRLLFTPCRISADPLDPGHGFAVLGRLYVYAYGADDFWIWPRTDTDYTFSLTDCAGLDTQLELWNGGGSVGFGAGHPGWNPCLGWIDEFPGTCCLPDGCSSLQRLECEYRGGVYLGFEPGVVLTPVPCSECVTPVERRTWGGVKLRH